MDAMFPRRHRARIAVLLLLGVLLGAFSYSWGYQSGSRQSAVTSSSAAAEREVELVRWYVQAARRAGYDADHSPCEPAGDDADARVRAHAESR
jgi:hypothetical protein